MASVTNGGATRLSDRALSLLRCPQCRSSLDAGPSQVTCLGCKSVFPIEKGVIRIIQHMDSFYEGTYTRQIKYIPGRNGLMNWGFFHLVQAGVLGDLRRVLPRNGRVLDLGCAGGIRWLGQTSETVGIDLSIASLVHAAEIYTVAIQAGVESLPVADALFDVVYGSYFFEHLSAESKRRCLLEIGRTLRPGGACLLQFDTLANNLLVRLARSDPAAFQRGFIDKDSHLGLEPLSSNLLRIEEAGLRVERVVKFGTTLLQPLPTYQWLEIAYGEKYRWARVVGRLARGLAKHKKLWLPFESAVTLFDRLISPMVDGDRATRVIVAARRPGSRSGPNA